MCRKEPRWYGVSNEQSSGSDKHLRDSLGPGLITGAADDDPSGIATYTVAGAQLGTGLLWTALITWPLMAAVQMMCARIGMVSGRGLTAAFKSKFARPLVLTAITALLIANTINVGADLAGMADAAELLTHVSSHLWVFLFAAGISWATVRLRYYTIASTLKWLALVLFAYVISAFVIHPDWNAAFRGHLLTFVSGKQDNLGHAGCNPGNHHQPLSFLLAGFAGSRRRKGSRP